MEIKKTYIDGLYIFEPKIHEDERGYFMETYRKIILQNEGIDIDFIQDNESKSNKGVLRGLHLQKDPYSQTKLVRVIEGEVLDVILDLRKNSETYGQIYTIKLSSENKLQMLIPKGCAHGYVVLSEKSIFNYKVDQIYAPDYEMGIIWNDKELNIDWILKEDEIIISEKDKELITFKEYTELL